MQSQNAGRKKNRNQKEKRGKMQQDVRLLFALVSVQPPNLRLSGFTITSIDLDRDPNVVNVCSPTAYEFQAVISQQIPA